MKRFSFPVDPVTDAENELRSRVRLFLTEQLSSGGFTPTADCWVSAVSQPFSEKLGANGWLGMTWPAEYGGAELPVLHRLVVTEELLAAGAPVAAHWIADRQTGPQILKFGTEEQKKTILPRMAQGVSFSCIGMSEPQAGSDLAAVITRATPTDSGWLLNGRKIWSTIAHLSDYMIVLARTSPADGRNRQVGLSQFLVDLSLPGISITGINDLAGTAHFNETLFDNVALRHDALLGVEGKGWSQVMGELAMERSGPERYLTTLIALEQALITLRKSTANIPAATIGRLIAQVMSLRRMSRSIARLIQDKKSPDTQAALVKQSGNVFEKELYKITRELLAAVPRKQWPENLTTLMRETQLRLPSHTLRGGTTEVMHGIIARQLGVR